MTDRIEAAAMAAAKDEDASNWHDEHEYYRNGWCNRMAPGIAAADAVMFSDEAIERAENAVYSLAAINAPEIVRTVVAALKGDA